ncbi:hypothetical protein AVEN_194546-1 [Araneus ventricosus]|uniref:Uncharacterized protein n=1 Tax=Araneus ventricosus TaxID=182803 RepID=A0A4Y2A6E1_ARAVE|nr:hypothetical protein AVEN_194546-1 [Araneus ventricosus]
MHPIRHWPWALPQLPQEIRPPLYRLLRMWGNRKSPSLCNEMSTYFILSPQGTKPTIHSPLFYAAVFTSLSEENLILDKCLEPRLDAKSGLYRRVAPDFPLQLLQQFFSFASSMAIVIQEDDTIAQHAKAFVSDGFTITQRLFPFSEIEGIHIWNKALFRQRCENSCPELAQWAET